MIEDEKPFEDNSEYNSNHVVSPSVFLQNLTAKVNGFQGGNNNSIAEVQRVRTELSNQVQSISNKQEMRMRELDSQLSMLQQEIRPKLQNVERQQGFTQKQLEEIRQRAQKLQMEDLSPLQYKFDQMGVRFDRFIRVELESKLKPLQDDLRQSRAKLDELSSTLNTSFRKIDEQVNEMTQKVKNHSTNLSKQKANYENQINSIEPRLDSLEREISGLSDSLNGYNAQGANGSGLFDPNGNPIDFSTNLNQVQISINRLQNETIPSSIGENSANLVDALQKITQFCDEQLAPIQSSLDEINCSNQVADSQQAEEQLNQLINTTQEVQHKLKDLDDDSSSKLKMIEQSIDSYGANLNSMLSNLTNEINDSNGKAQNSIDENIRQLRSSIQTSLEKLKNNISVKSKGNFDAQTEMLSQLSQLKNLLYGKENAVERLESAESRLKWCINSIQEIDEERLDAQKINGGPTYISIRINSIEERLEKIGSRLKNLEKKNVKGRSAINLSIFKDQKNNNDNDGENDKKDADVKKDDSDKNDNDDENDKKDANEDAKNDDNNKNDNDGQNDKKDTNTDVKNEDNNKNENDDGKSGGKSKKTGSKDGKKKKRTSKKQQPPANPD